MFNHVGTQQIETSRLILRRHEITDADDWYNNWVTDPEVSRFWGWDPHNNIDETIEYLTWYIGEYEKINTYNRIIVLKEISKAIGYIYLNEFDDNDGSAAVHFAISRKYWNQGITTEACKAVLDFAFSELGTKRIHTRHHIDNPASGEVMKKCGMQYVKTEYKSFPDCERINGDYKFYEILRKNL